MDNLEVIANKIRKSILRNTKGQFIKGSKPIAPFKKGQGYWTGKKRSPWK